MVWSWWCAKVSFWVYSWVNLPSDHGVPRGAPGLEENASHHFKVKKTAWLPVIARQRGEVVSGVVISGTETSFWADFLRFLKIALGHSGYNGTPSQ